MASGAKRVLIVDDEPGARAQLRDVINTMPDLLIIGEVDEGGAAIKAIIDHVPDIVFLDIDMPDVDGFGVAEATAHLMYQLVFVTAYHQYALRAFETRAIDYLLKPARPSTIERCLAKILHQEVLSLEMQSGESTRPDLVLSDSGTTRFISSSHVLFIEGLGRYRRVHLSAAGAAVHQLDTVLSDTTLDDFTDQLAGRGFIRIHRSYLINLSLVVSIKSRGRQHDVFLEGATAAIPVARSRLKDLKVALGASAIG